MRYLAHAIGIVMEAAGVLLVLTASIIWVRGRPNSRILFVAGVAFFSSGFLIKRASRLKKCSRCQEKSERDAAKCHRCGFDFPANAAESFSEPFYK